MRKRSQHLRRSVGWPVAGLAVIALVLSGCGGSKHAHVVTTANGVVVGCASAVYGQLAAGWRSPRHGALVAGPIAWVIGFVGHQPSSAYAPSHGLAPGVKALAVVNAGPGVTVSVPAGERNRLSLDYTDVQPRSPAGGAAYRVSDGASAFRPCARGQGLVGPDGRTQFAGGFIVSGAQCAELDIQPVASTVRMRRYIPFGRSCSTRSA